MQVRIDVKTQGEDYTAVCEQLIDIVHGLGYDDARKILEQGRLDLQPYRFVMGGRVITWEGRFSWESR